MWKCLKDVVVVVWAIWSAFVILIYTVLSVVQGDEFVVGQQIIAMGISVPVLGVIANLVAWHFSKKDREKRDADILTLLREHNSLLERLTTAIERSTPSERS